MSKPEDLRDELVRLERRTELILTSAGEGIYGINCQGRLTFVNPAAAEMLGWARDELEDQCPHESHHHSRPDGSPYPREECPIYAAFRDGLVHTVDDEVFWRRDGTSFPVEYVSTPIHEGDELKGAVVVFRDITARRRAERDLHAALAQVEALKNRLEAENTYLQEEIKTQHNFDEIIGTSPAIENMRAAIETVAPSDANVLVHGETGTGKELVARAIHARGPRKGKPLIKVNCASIPRELFESEFFGHVKGAFTGALKDRAGRFQLAHKGTLFLDEVGEIPVEMQSKLLRVLQEGEFERVGDEVTRQVDVRVIAATNRDLRREAEAGRFRQDLYYRLNVFPIEVAPLRNRDDDIALLAPRFLAACARKLNRRVPALKRNDLRQLSSYDWPGNIRELQNVIERAAITCRGDTLRFDLPKGSTSVSTGKASATAARKREQIQTGEVIPEVEMRQLECDNLIAALARTDWRIYGPAGAAELLGVKATTLASRIKKLGLDRPRRA